jgi:cell shape-determining protein MreC
MLFYLFIFSIYLFVYLFINLCYVILQKGTPWECGLSLHSATTDTAHVPWFSHSFATIDNFCLVFLQWLKKTKSQKNKNQETKKTNNQKTKKNDKTQLSATTPPLWVCSLVFFWFLCFLVSCFLVRCLLFEGLRT